MISPSIVGVDTGDGKHSTRSSDRVEQRLEGRPIPDRSLTQGRRAFFKAIHGTFNHLLIADRVWLGRFEGVTVPDGFMGPGGIRSLDQELYADFDVLRRERVLTDELTAWVSGLTTEQLAAPLVFMRRSQKHESPLWWSVVHLFNHQTHHRGQITTLLAQQGCDPGVTDLFAMLREEAARASAHPSSRA